MSTSSHVKVYSSILVMITTACCFMRFGDPIRFPSLVAAASRLHEGNHTDDQLVLLAFKAGITDDPFKALSSWNQSSHFCQWHGVTCGGRHQRVTRLDLASHKLVGSIPPHLGNLSFLRALDLQNNSFAGEIPPQLGRLQRLQDLFLNNNSISGKIPANLSGCSNLLRFDLGSNKLVGEIPAEIGSLSKLRNFFIPFNSLTGEIPHSFANLTSLEMLYALFNNFGGSIPDALGQLANLRVLSLGANGFSGTIPPSIFNLTSLISLDVVNNNIHGSLPPEIGLTLPNLKFLAIGNNQITGSIPASLSNASNLEIISAAISNLNGKVPSFQKLNKLRFVSLAINRLGSGGVDHDLEFLSSLTNATDLRFLGLDDNEFGGTLPESISNLSTKLETFTLAYNGYIVGSIPSGIVNLVNLSRLSLWGNQLTGNIPTDIGKLKRLEIWNFSKNKLSGTIPFSIGNLSLLAELVLGQNNFQGIIPSSIGNLENLLRLELSSNNLSGTIPPQVIGLSSLAKLLNLSRNRLSGSLPMEVGNLVNLLALDVSDNMLSGALPSTLGSCVVLEVLDLKGNFFQGFVPSSLQSLRGLQELDLSRNNFSGTIPDYLTSFDLKVLNLSYNEFVGEVPIKGVFRNASAISVTGNSELCGGILELQLPSCNFIRSKISKATVIKLVIILLSCGLLGVILASCFLCKKYGRRKSRTEVPSGLPAIANSLLNVSYQSLLKAADGFSSDNLLGAGNFGSVYKGIINQDGTTLEVAVKVLNLSRRGAFKSFLSECEALRNIRHRNLVKVLTACSGADYQGNDFVALVYEYMVNGNLDEWLHLNPNQGEYEGTRSLSLLQRLNIAQDVACALDYLHHHAHSPMVHCDLKPSNILLNDELTGHVGDFGLTQILPNNSPCSNSTHQANPSSIGLRGTLGYTAPEYGMGSAVSASGDVYSYGILLLEMFTGKRPTDQMFGENLNLHDYVKMALPERVADVADPIVLRHTNPRPRDQTYANVGEIEECLISVFGIGLSCSEENPRERPDINGIAGRLLVIKNKFKGIGGTRGGSVR